MGKHRQSYAVYLQEVILPYESDECFIWPFTIRRDGYADIWFGSRLRKAHRVVCEQTHGLPPTPLHEAAHSCGKKACVNPRHLRWATHIENEADKRGHGTLPLGSDNGKAKLTPSEVRAIRMLRGKIPQKQIAAKFNVSAGAVTSIFIGQTWSWLR